MCIGHDHSSHWIEGKGQWSRLGLKLGCQFKTRSVGRRSSIEDSLCSLLILFVDGTASQQVGVPVIVVVAVVVTVVVVAVIVVIIVIVVKSRR